MDDGNPTEWKNRSSTALDSRAVHEREGTAALNPGNSQFATTHWTLVWQAAKEDSKHGRPALTEVVRCYWQPLYTFARKQGMSSQDAEDATQEFLSAIINGELLDSADPAKGKFRSFLLTVWKRFLVDQYRKESAAKRGGNLRQLSLDVGNGEQTWLALESREPDADRVFMRSWASSLLAEAKHRLRMEYYAKNRSALFEALVPRLTRSMDAAQYEELSEKLDMSSGTVKVALHRLRQKFGNSLREVVSETVEDPQEVDLELTELLQVLRDNVEE